MMFLKREFVYRLIVIVMAIAGLYLGGLGLDQLHLDVWADRTFFRLRFYALAEVPFWFLAGLVMLVLNGFFLLRWSVIEGSIATPQKRWWWPFGGQQYGLNVPLPTLKMIGLNMLVIPAIWFVYILLVSTH